MEENIKQNNYKKVIIEEELDGCCCYISKMCIILCFYSFFIMNMKHKNQDQ